MKKYPKSPEELTRMANEYYAEILDRLPFAVNCDDLFEIRAFKTNKTTALVHQNTEVTLHAVYKKEDFFAQVKKACIQSKQHLLEESSFRQSGLYVFSVNKKPIYIGISRNLYDRVKQHFYGKTHFSASLAYRISKEENGHDGARKELDFTEEQLSMQKRIKINFVPIEDSYEMYWMEVTLAGMFGTKYNEFETH